jgi:hypothetical protein
MFVKKSSDMTLKLRYDSDGRAFSPVIRANSKFFGKRALCVDVRFRNVEQLDLLIEALVKLREFPSDGYNHVHLQDERGDLASAEVTFWHPSVKRDSIAKSCVRLARETIKAIALVDRRPYQ